MKFQPTLRDFLWLTLVAALLVRWFVDHRDLSAKKSSADWKPTSGGVTQHSIAKRSRMAKGVLR